jgi:hypothetical protein
MNTPHTIGLRTSKLRLLQSCARKSAVRSSRLIPERNEPNAKNAMISDPDRWPTSIRVIQIATVPAIMIAARL